MERKKLLRILDANLNRSREGLRVCEELARFALDDRRLTAALKAARHGVTAAAKKMPLGPGEPVSARDSRGDVGREPSPLERKRRSGAAALFAVNAHRAMEALRVLEEASKLVEPAAGDRFKRIRFKVYDIEKRALPKLEALRDHGPVR